MRRQGHYIQQIDEMGGWRFDQTDEDIGRIRSDLQAALRTLEEKVAISMDNLDLRMQRIEGTVAMLRDAKNPGHPPSQPAARINTSPGAPTKQL